MDNRPCPYAGVCKNCDCDANIFGPNCIPPERRIMKLISNGAVTAEFTSDERELIVLALRYGYELDVFTPDGDTLAEHITNTLDPDHDVLMRSHKYRDN